MSARYIESKAGATTYTDPALVQLVQVHTGLLEGIANLIKDMAAPYFTLDETERSYFLYNMVNEIGIRNVCPCLFTRVPAMENQDIYTFKDSRIRVKPHTRLYMIKLRDGRRYNMRRVSLRRIESVRSKAKPFPPTKKEQERRRKFVELCRRRARMKAAVLSGSSSSPPVLPSSSSSSSTPAPARRGKKRRKKRRHFA